ncbi:hypothetical protein GOODEAATRI_027418 [Goodea atripinnis]|uniref:Uncharacterized protein n=1 Tax=Goodea atripinnis TaxID=208336 RepID=A0ABV0MYP1_9TELE
MALQSSCKAWNMSFKIHGLDLTGLCVVFEQSVFGVFSVCVIDLRNRCNGVRHSQTVTGAACTLEAIQVEGLAKCASLCNWPGVNSDLEVLCLQV